MNLLLSSIIYDYIPTTYINTSCVSLDSLCVYRFAYGNNVIEVTHIYSPGTYLINFPDNRPSIILDKDGKLIFKDFQEG